ncbi:ribonuclease H-like domain-containing protein, partial [Tanacetum coccineum]
MSNNEPANESSEIFTLNFFDHYESEPTTKTPLRPNDDEEGTHGRDGRVHQPEFRATTDHARHDGEYSATLIGDQTQSEGNVGSSYEVPVFQNDFPNTTEEVGPRRYANHSMLSPENYNFVSNMNKSSEPSSYEEALKDVNWINALNDEMHALYENTTWFMTDLPIGRKPTGCKWDFRIKYKSNGEVERYKARLVAKGFSQKEDIDYEETLEEVYMVPPPGFFNSGETKVCKLEKSLYGLKPALRQWNHKLYEALLESCFMHQHMHAPLKSHFDIALRVLKCLKLSPGLGVEFTKRKSDCVINAFSDSDWAK